MKKKSKHKYCAEHMTNKWLSLGTLSVFHIHISQLYLQPIEPTEIDNTRSVRIIIKIIIIAKIVKYNAKHARTLILLLLLFFMDNTPFFQVTTRIVILKCAIIIQYLFEPRQRWTKLPLF